MNDRDFIASIRAQCDAQLGTPEVTPPVTPPVTPSVPGVIVHQSLGNAGVAQNLTSQLGVIHAFPLPAGAHTISSTGIAGTPQELKLKWAISPIAGDFSYAMTTGASVVGRGGVVYHPCIASGGVESGGIKWNTTGDSGTCKVTKPMYANVMFESGIPPDTDVSITYSWW